MARLLRDTGGTALAVAADPRSEPCDVPLPESERSGPSG
jgi:hypothetical protein